MKKWLFILFFAFPLSSLEVELVDETKIVQSINFIFLHQEWAVQYPVGMEFELDPSVEGKLIQFDFDVYDAFDELIFEGRLRTDQNHGIARYQNFKLYEAIKKEATLFIHIYDLKIARN